MGRFQELKGLSIFIKITVFLEIVIGIVFALFIDTGWLRAAGLIASLLIAFTYWIQARFIDILMQINSNTMDTLTEVRSLLSEHRRAAATTVASAPRTPVTGQAPASHHSAAAPTSAVLAETPTPTLTDGAWAAQSRGRVGSRVAVEVLPTSSQPRGQVTIYVSGAHAKAAVSLLLVDSTGICRWKAATWTNRDGALRYGMSVPSDLTTGSYSVVANTASDSASAPLTVTA